VIRRKAVIVQIVLTTGAVRYSARAWVSRWALDMETPPPASITGYFAFESSFRCPCDQILGTRAVFHRGARIYLFLQFSIKIVPGNIQLDRTAEQLSHVETAAGKLGHALRSVDANLELGAFLKPWHLVQFLEPPFPIPMLPVSGVIATTGSEPRKRRLRRR